MNNAPVFEKKGVNYSGYIYTYLPVDLPVYAAEVTHKDPVNGELLQKALEKTLKRMPCPSVNPWYMENQVVFPSQVTSS